MSWLQRLFARKRMEIDLDKELRFHFEAQVADKVRSGIPESEARRLTRLEFGGMEQIKEDCRERRGTLWLESIVQDVRYGLRQLRKSPGFTLTAVITVALGIGATTAIFTLVQGVLERSLPVTDPSRLYRVGDQGTCCYYGLGFEREDGDFDLFPYDLYLNLKQSSPEFEQLAALEAGGSSISVRREHRPAPAAALGICLRQLLRYARCRRVRRTPAYRERRQSRSRARPRPQLPRLAVRLRRRSDRRRLHRLC